MPLAPVLPPMPAQVAVAHQHPHPTAVPMPHATASGVRAQTAKAVKHAGETDRAGRSRSGTDSDAAIDEDANALDAKSKRRPGQHRLDVEV
jgi:hypothetical protein